MENVTLWIVRHGKTLLNELNRVQGWCDAPLTPAGLESIEKLAKGLADISFNAVYSSDSGRAMHTAQMILEHNHHKNHLQITPDSRLREYYFGSYEGEDDDKMKQELAKFLGMSESERQESSRPSLFTNTVCQMDQASRKEKILHDVPLAENFEELSLRLMQVLTEIATINEDKENILVVSHGVAIWTIWEKVNNLAGYAGGGIANGSVMKIQYEKGGFTILTANDKSYIS